MKSTVFVAWLSAFMLVSHTLAVNQAGSVDRGNMTDPEKKAWITKLARTLRDNNGLTPRDDLRALMALKPLEVVDHFMKDPGFEDAVLSFNLYFLGFKRDRLRYADGSFAQYIYGMPSAISAAKAIAEGGDYFSLFSLDQPRYFAPLAKKISPNSRDEDEIPGEKDTEALRQAHFDRHQKFLEQSAIEIEADATHSITKLCSTIERSEYDFPFGSGMFGDFGAWLLVAEDAYGPITSACLGFPPEHFDPVAELRRLIVFNKKLYSDIYRDFHPSKYLPKHLNEIRTLDFPLQEKWNIFTPVVRDALVNSSTNYNRKRAAWVLKRFFCDDLTPINVKVPAEHANTKHGSTQSCYSCHYKLDPMAGFFKNYGVLFADYSKSSSIVFDDFGKIQRSIYDSSWLAPPKSGRVWDIGYIRTTRPDQEKLPVELRNEYASSADPKFEDLFGIIEKAPEVKRCIVKRMFEYFVAEDQAIDAGYLDDLKARFIEKSKTSTSDAFKSTLKEIVLSESFRKVNPVQSECYDYPPGHDPKGSPPCKVAFILQNNCIKCHGPSTGQGLDLSQWVKNSEGVLSFPHFSKDKKPVPPKTTFDMITQRLSSSDQAARMPLGMEMSPLDRETLYIWANQMFNTISHGSAR